MNNKRGFVLINVLGVFIIFNIFVFYYISVYRLNIKTTYHMNTLNERLQLEKELINTIVTQLKEYEEEDFNYDVYESNVEVSYSDVTATITVTGKHNFEAILVYDDINNIIQAYRYN